MITVLWVMGMAAVVSLAGLLAGRNSVRAARNRTDAWRAYWEALGCGRRAQAAVDSLLAGASGVAEAGRIWRTLPVQVAASPMVTGCDVSFEAAGTHVDVNAATSEVIARALASVTNVPDSIAAAIVARRDTSPFIDVGELRSIRGLESATTLDSLFSVEPGRVSLATAPVQVLLAIPGFTAETADNVVAAQNAGTPIEDLTTALIGVSNTAASELVARFPDAARLTTPDPDAWVMRSRAARGVPLSEITIEMRLARVANGVAVIRLRARP